MIDEAPSPELETGWLATTPENDSYVRRFLLNWAGSTQATARSFGGSIAKRHGVHLADSGRPVVFSNCATLLQPLDAETAWDTMVEIDEFFGFTDPSRIGEVLLLSAWPTGDLQPYGWRLMGYPPLHLLPHGARPSEAPRELEIKAVTDLTGLYAWERVAIAGYPLEGLGDAPPGSIVSEAWLSDPRHRLWVGWSDGRPVACSSAWVEQGINHVSLVVTMPDARRRGFGEALTWRAALADPSLPAMLLSSDDGRPVYERMGFLPLLRMTLWYRGRPGAG